MKKRIILIPLLLICLVPGVNSIVNPEAPEYANEFLERVQKYEDYVINEASTTMEFLQGLTKYEEECEKELKKAYDRYVGQYILKNSSRAVALNKVELSDYIDLGVRPDYVSIITNTIDDSICPELPDGDSFRRRFGIKPVSWIL